MNIKALAFTLLLLPAAASAAEIASVHFGAIKDALREHYFSKPENAEIRDRYLNAAQEEKKRLEEVQASIAGGQSSIDIKKMMPKAGASDRFQLEREINADLRKELYLVIRGMGLNYEFIYDASDADAVIFAKAEVQDITALVRQAIIDLEKKP